MFRRRSTNGIRKVSKSDTDRMGSDGIAYWGDY